MKNNVLYVLVGIPGSGKSTFLSQNNLEKLTVSLDTIRELFTSPAISEEGFMVLNNLHNDAIWSIMKNQVIPHRMKHGGSVFLDATNLYVNDIKGFKKLAEDNHYQFKVIDFGLRSIDFYKNNNKNRKSHKVLPEKQIEKMYKVRQNLDLQEFDTISPEEVAKEMRRTAEDLLINVDKYEKIFFFGDIHGCIEPIKDFFSKIPFSENNLYIFVGDYIDRGIQNAEVLTFVENHIMKENMIFMKGNHEENLYNYIINGSSNFDFMENTLPELMAANFTKEKISHIYDNLEEILYLSYNGRNILVSHGGFASVPKEPSFLSRTSNSYGYGNFSEDVDTLFNKNEVLSNWYQVHGHRNAHNLPIINDRSINLDGAIEYGENLRVLSMSPNGNRLNLEEYYINNKVYKKTMLKENEIELVFNKSEKENISVMKYVHTNGIDLLKNLRDNPLIKEMVSETEPHISAFNFTKNAFFESQTSFLDELVSHARGLFLNNATGEIISRGYEKFFNVNEVPQSTWESVEKNFKFPLIGYRKENGFFGTIGYDSVSDKLIPTSKSRIDGEFPDYFKNIIESTFSESEKQMLKRYAIKYNVNYIFEVNDPLNDPHIIEYKAPHIVLLSIVKRDLTFVDVNYETLVGFTKQFKNLAVKEVEMKLPNIQAFKGYYNALLTGKKSVDHEGFVFEDQDANKIKIKSPYYSAWKYIRSSIERYNNKITKLNSLEWSKEDRRYINEKEKIITSIFSKVQNAEYFNDNIKKELVVFFNWFLEQNEEKQHNSIISLRNEFKKIQTSEHIPENTTQKKKMKI